MTSQSGHSGAAAAEELERLKLLYRIGRLIDPSSDSRQVLRAILREAVRAMRASSGSIALIDRHSDTLVIEVAVNIDPQARKSVVLKMGEGVTGRCAKLGRAFRVNDVRNCGFYVPVRDDVAAEMAAPLTVEGRVIGVLNVDSDRRNAFSADDEALLSAAAEEAARVFQIARLREEIQDQSAKLHTLFRVGQTLTTAPTLGEALNRIAAEARAVMNAKVSSIMMLDERGETLSIEATDGAAQSYRQRAALRVENTFVGEIAMGGAPVAVRDVRRARRFRQNAMARREGLVSLLCAPIIYLGRPIGVLNVYTGEPKDFSEAEKRLLMSLAGQSAIAIESARRLERIERTEEQLRRSEKLSMLGALSAEIAHEIRNPITIVRMLVESLAADIPAGDPRRRDAAVIQEKLGQINRIVSHALDVSKVREPHTEPFDAHARVEDALFMAQRRLAGSAIAVRRRFASDLPMALGDPAEFEQVLLNLVMNACEAMPGGGTLTVLSRLKRRGPYPRVAVRVADTGPGVPEDSRERIFSPFYTTRPDGVGMGLFVARKLIREHKGELTVDGKPGKGAVFEVTLPAAG